MTKQEKRLLNHEKSHGVEFSVQVGGQRAFQRKLAGGERTPAEIGMDKWRGQAVTVEFIVDALGDPSYGWATWVAPRVVVRR